MFLRKKDSKGTNSVVLQDEQLMSEDSIIYRLNNMIYSRTYFEKIRWNYLLIEIGELRNEIVCYFNDELVIIGLAESGFVVVLEFDFECQENYLASINFIEPNEFLNATFAYDDDNNITTFSVDKPYIYIRTFDGRGNFISREKALIDGFVINPLEGKSKLFEEFYKEVYLDYYNDIDSNEDYESEF